MNPKQPNIDKLAMIHSVMRNPKLSRSIFDGVSSPIGSTKRAQSKSMISILNRTNGIKSDGQGGPNDMSMDMSNYQLPTMSTPTDSSFSYSGTGNPTPQSLYSNVTIFPSIPSFKSGNLGSGLFGGSSGISDSLSKMFSGLSLDPNANKPLPNINKSINGSTHSNISSGGMSTVGNDPFAKAFSMANTGGGQSTDTSSSGVDTTHTIKTGADGSKTQSVVTKAAPGQMTGPWASGYDPKITQASTGTDTSSTDTSGVVYDQTSSNQPTNAVVSTVSKMLNVSDPTISLSQVIANQPNGAASIADIMIKHEGSQIDPTFNNPGDIKFGTLAKSLGAVDSGVAGADGGTWAKFPTLDAGKAAVATIVNNYANNGSNFQDFVNYYTTGKSTAQLAAESGGTSGGTSSTGGAMTIEDAMNQAPNFISKNTGSEYFANYFAGAIATNQLPQNEAILKQQYGLDALLARKTELATENPTLVQDMTDYIKGKDTYLASINAMINSTKNTMLTTNISDPTTNKMYTDYMNYLTNLKGSQMKTYGDYLNRSIAQYNTDVTTVDNQYSTAQTAYNSAISDQKTLDKTNYDNVHKALVDAYNSMTPEKLLAAKKASDELNGLSLDTVNSVTGFKPATIAEQNSYADKIINTTKDTNTGEVNGALLPDANLPSLIKTLSLGQGLNPAGIIDLFTSGAKKTLGGYLGTKDPQGNLTGTNGTVMKNALGYINQIETGVKLLSPLQQQQLAPNVKESTTAILNMVKSGVQNYLTEHAADVQSAVNELSGIKAHWWSGKPNVTSLVQFQNDNANVDKDILESLWTQSQLEKQTYENHTGNPNFTLADGFKTADSKGLLSGTQGEKMASYLGDTILAPYEYIANNGYSFSDPSPIPFVPVMASSLPVSNNAGGQATFEGYKTFYGGSQAPDPAKIIAFSPDDGMIKAYTPNNEPIFARNAQLEASRAQEMFNADPYWKNNGYSLTTADNTGGNVVNGTTVQFDHVVPLEAGGNNSTANIMLISTVADQGNQQFEDTLGQMYSSGKISRANAAKAAIDYKINGTIQLKDLLAGTY